MKKLILVILLSVLAACSSSVPQDTQPPATPTNLVATAGNASVALTWTASADADLKGYNLYWGKAADALNDSTFVAKANISKTVSGLSNGTAYFFALDAEDTAENKSLKTGVVSATPVAPSQDLTVSISSPSGTAYTNGSINIQVVVSGGTPDSVELLKDDAVLVGNLAAPYTYTWDTSSEAEGSYSLKARASKDGEAFESEEAVTIVVDRTAPTITERTPAPGADNVLYSAPIVVEFSEPMLASTVTSGNVQLFADSNPVSLTSSLTADGLTLTLQAAEGGITEFPTQPELSLSNLTDLAGNELPLSGWGWLLPDWLAFGDLKLNGETIGDNASVVLDAQNRPILAYVDDQNSDDAKLWVKRWDGSAWQAMGSGSLNHDPDAIFSYPSGPSMVLDSARNPVIAWTERENSVYTIYVKHWNGSSWEAVGPGFNHDPTNAGGVAFRPSLGLDDAGNPVVAWSEIVADFTQVFVNRWNGSAWEALGTTSLNIDASKNVLDLSLAIDPAGNPVVAWSEGNAINVDPPNLVYVKRWDGANWQLLGSTPNSAINTNFETQHFAFTLDASGKPWVALTLIPSSSSFRYLAVVHLEGDDWVWLESDPRSTTATSANLPSLAIDASGNPVISWAESGTPEDPRYVKRWTGSSWKQIGESLGDTSTSYESPLVLDSEGNPVVAFINYHDNTNSFVVVQANH